MTCTRKIFNERENVNQPLEIKNRSMKPQAEERAQVLIDALVKGGISADMADEIREWLSQEGNLTGKLKALEQAYYEAVHTDPNPDLAVYDAYRRLAERLGFPEEVLPKARKQRLSGRRILWRVAAVVLPLMVLAGAWFYVNRESGVEPAPLVAQVEWIATEGAVKYIKLPDGSQVWLEEGMLSYPEDPTGERQVSLAGKAYFSVARDEDRPFRVETDNLTVAVLGTEFLVDAVSDAADLSVTVTSGVVRVNAADQAYRLERNNRLVYRTSDSGVELKQVDDAELTALRAVQLHFDYVPLGEAFDAIANYYGVTFIIEGEIPGHEALRVRFDGTDSLDDVLFIVRHAALGMFDYAIDSDTVRITVQ